MNLWVSYTIRHILQRTMINFVFMGLCIVNQYQ